MASSRELASFLLLLLAFPLLLSLGGVGPAKAPHRQEFLGSVGDVVSVGHGSWAHQVHRFLGHFARGGRAGLASFLLAAGALAPTPAAAR